MKTKLEFGKRGREETEKTETKPTPMERFTKWCWRKRGQPPPSSEKQVAPRALPQRRP
jgi:hypothetical protein